MSGNTIRIEGLTKLTAALGGLEGIKFAKAGIKAAALHIKGKIAKYPPGSDANIPGPYPKRWYIRGAGQYWARADGSVGRRLTSEDLGQRWTIQELNGGFGAKVGNNVSYGKFVQDADYQASFHKRRGWKTTQDVAKEEADEVNDLIRKEVEKVINRA
jgi:hypothetical protein